MKNRTIPVLLALAFTAAALCSPAAYARSLDGSSAADSPSTTATAKLEAAQMVPAAAVLAQTIDARKARAGEQFQARLTKAVMLKNGTALPKGTVLVGTIVKDKMNPDGTSTLALRFTAANMKQGTTVPIVARIVGVAPPDYGDEWSGGDEAMTPSPWSRGELVVEQIGALPGFNLHSRIAGPDSATFTSRKKSEMKLDDWTQLSLAIAGRSANHSNGGI